MKQISSAPAGFWHKLPRPFFALAPMEDVTDLVFRSILQRCGAPDVWFTEFAKASGVAGSQIDSHQRMCWLPGQKPLVAQIWGNKPADYRMAIYRLRAWGFDGIDINMGCPQPVITAKGACSALIKNPTLAVELIQAAREAAEDTGPEARAQIASWGCLDPQVASTALPLSVKTRVAFLHPAKAAGVEAWLSTILAQKPAALTIHGRSAQQQSEGLADWRWVELGVALRNQLSPSTVLIGNGDIQNPQDGLNRAAQSGADGIMVGRALFTDPCFFGKANFKDWPRQAKIALALEHLDRYQDFWGQSRNWEIIKKFFKIYLQDFADANELRALVMAMPDYHGARQVLKEAFGS